jgi:ArsR family transcriptional regulator
MRRGGLVVSRRDGKRVLYRLSSDQVLDLLAALRGLAEQNVAEARQTIADYFTSRDSMEPLSSAELTRALKRHSVVLLDVRPEAEFELGHLRGAVNVPLKDLARARTLPRGKDIIAYCRGPYCVLAFEAVATLRKHGFSARRLDGGMPEFTPPRAAVAHGRRKSSGVTHDYAVRTQRSTVRH